MSLGSPPADGGCKAGRLSLWKTIDRMSGSFLKRRASYGCPTNMFSTRSDVGCGKTLTRLKPFDQITTQPLGKKRRYSCHQYFPIMLFRNSLAYDPAFFRIFGSSQRFRQTVGPFFHSQC